MEASPTPNTPKVTTYPSQPARVGDGFVINRAIPLQGLGLEAMEPFLMLDHAGPTTYGPTHKARGVDVHPHKGFQTVTLAYQGDLVHRDSAGNRGELSPGDVQWMTAGRGIVHEEKHGPELTRNGGVSEMIQLWINLPADDKHVAPHYTDYKSDVFPVIPLGGEGSNFLRLIAGKWDTYTGPASTYSPLTLADFYLDAGSVTTFNVDPTWNTALYALIGSATINGRAVGPNQIIKLDAIKEVKIVVTAACHLLLMSGHPLGEPIASYGPFVMNNQDELRVAIAEYQEGKMGTLS